MNSWCDLLYTLVTETEAAPYEDLAILAAMYTLSNPRQTKDEERLVRALEHFAPPTHYSLCLFPSEPPVDFIYGRSFGASLCELELEMYKLKESTDMSSEWWTNWDCPPAPRSVQVSFSHGTVPFSRPSGKTSIAHVLNV